MKIRTELFDIPGAPLEGLNPLPKFRDRKPSEPKCSDRFPDKFKETLGTYQQRVLPYLMQDRYSRRRDMLHLKSFVMENEYLMARFLPGYGGRLHSLFDKVNNQELLFANSVIQPGNLAIRNAWLSGGIEWNVGHIGHTFTTCDNVFAAVLQDGEGNEFMRIYEFERMKSVFWQVDFHLPEGSPYLQVHARLINPFDEDTTTYWWSNVAVPDTGKTRVLASGRQAFTFTRGLCDYERLPYIEAFPGADMSYPSRATRAFDYFIQENFEGESTWEAAAYPDGLVFYERSTAPLVCKKLFGWGNHHAGTYWQEHLSDGEGTGYYAELQAGIAPSQLNDKHFPAHSIYEWTQCFGGVQMDPALLYMDDCDVACKNFDDKINTFLTAEVIAALDEKLKTLADLPVTPADIRHEGCGFGALEGLRMEKDGDGHLPATLCFPLSTIGAEERPWLQLLTEGKLPEEDIRTAPASYIVSGKWKKHLEASLQGNGRHWLSLLHYGVMLYEWSDLSKVACCSYDEEQEKTQRKQARAAWEESVKLQPNMWAYRNLAVLENTDGNPALAEEYYDKAIAFPGAFDDFALASEYMLFLAAQNKSVKLWELYVSLPETCKKVDRIGITAARAAVKLDNLEYLTAFFAQPHHDIKEGECSLTDIWFEFCARRLARERGVDVNNVEEMQKLLDEAWDTCPPDPSIDFRMSFDRQLQYRVE